MSVESKLLDAKIHFYLENPQNAIQLLQEIKSKDPKVIKEKDILMYRCFIIQKKFSIPMTEINPHNSSVTLQSIRLLANYLCNKNNYDEIQAEIEHLQTKNLDVDDDVSFIMWALFYVHAKKPELALKVLHNSNSLESQALTIQILLQMNLFAMAQKKLKLMVEENEDDVLTQLTIAAVHLCMSGPKLREAVNIYQELSEKYRTTSNLLLNGKAAALIGLGDYDEADSTLVEAIARNPNDPDSLVNLMVLSQIQGKSSEITNRYIAQLTESDPFHPLVLDWKNKEAEFDALAQNA